MAGLPSLSPLALYFLLHFYYVFQSPFGASNGGYHAGAEPNVEALRGEREDALLWGTKQVSYFFPYN